MVLPPDDGHRQMPMNTTYLQFKGVWDMQDLYEFLASFFSKRKYKFYESKYIVKYPSPFGPESYYVWIGEIEFDEYAKFEEKIFLHTYDTQDVQVTMNNGEKKTFTKGRLWIQIKGKVITDYEGRWDESVFFMHLKDFYHKFVMKKYLEGVYWDDMYYNVHLKLHSLIKERLKMQSDSFEHRNFNKVR